MGQKHSKSRSQTNINAYVKAENVTQIKISMCMQGNMCEETSCVRVKIAFGIVLHILVKLVWQMGNNI